MISCFITEVFFSLKFNFENPLKWFLLSLKGLYLYFIKAWYKHYCLMKPNFIGTICMKGTIWDQVCDSSNSILSTPYLWWCWKLLHWHRQDGTVKMYAHTSQAHPKGVYQHMWPQQKVHKGFVYMEIQFRMSMLPQVGILANKLQCISCQTWVLQMWT